VRAVLGSAWNVGKKWVIPEPLQFAEWHGYRFTEHVNFFVRLQSLFICSAVRILLGSQLPPVDPESMAQLPRLEEPMLKLPCKQGRFCQ